MDFVFSHFLFLNNQFVRDFFQISRSMEERERKLRLLYKDFLCRLVKVVARKDDRCQEFEGSSGVLVHRFPVRLASFGHNICVG